jgi:hypothetical protein
VLDFGGTPTLDSESVNPSPDETSVVVVVVVSFRRLVKEMIERVVT